MNYFNFLKFFKKIIFPLKFPKISLKKIQPSQYEKPTFFQKKKPFPSRKSTLPPHEKTRKNPHTLPTTRRQSPIAKPHQTESTEPPKHPIAWMLHARYINRRGRCAASVAINSSPSERVPHT